MKRRAGISFFFFLLAGCVGGTLIWDRPKSLVGELTLSSLEPITGGWRGGFDLTLKGTGFTTQTLISVGGTACPISQVVSATELRCRMPVLNPTFDTLDVVIADPNGSSASLSDAFTPRSFVYVTSWSADEIKGYEILSNGSLAALAGGTVTTSASDPARIEILPNGKMLFATHPSGSKLSAFVINPLDGSLTAAGPPQNAGESPVGLAVHGDSTNVYVTNEITTTGTVRRFLVDSDTGAVTPGESRVVGSSPKGIVVHPSNAFLYSSDLSSDMFIQIILDGSGALGAVTGYQMDTNVQNISELAMDPRGRFFYGMTPATLSIDGRSISSSGFLFTMGGLPLSTGSATTHAEIDPAANFLIILQSSAAKIAWRSISGTGALGSELNIGGASLGMHVKCHPTGRFVALVQGPSTNLLTIFPRDVDSGVISGAVASETVNTPSWVVFY